MSTDPNKELKDVLRKYGASVISEMRTRLKSANKIASKRLYNSLKYEIVETLNTIEVLFFAEDYYKYVDKGVKPSKYANSKGSGTGKSKFISNLQKWCRKKGIPQSAAFAIRRHIWKFGIAPTNFFTISIKRREKIINKQIEKAIQKDLERQLNDMIKEENLK